MSSNRQRKTVAGLIVIVMIFVVAMYVGYVYEIKKKKFEKNGEFKKNGEKNLYILRGL
jgi:hypothetical protein